LASRRKTVERLEVMAGPTGRRSWPDAVKAGVAPQQLTTWRRQARRGTLALPAESPIDFAALVLDEPPPPSAKVPAPIEIEAGGVIVRLAGDCPAARVAEIAIALRAST
jgi:transposase